MRSGLTLGYLPLLDAAPLLVAEARGLFAAEGLQVLLSREAAWATVRDKLAVGALDGAHLLAPMALAATLGVGGDPFPIVAPLALNRGGAAITLAARLGEGFGDLEPAAGLARLVERRREQGASPLTFAVVFPVSSHAYLLRSWLKRAEIAPGVDVAITVAPPQRMPDLLADGVIEGFCAGEPWNAAAEARGAGRVVARAEPDAPDKVLGLRGALVEDRPDAASALVRATARAAAWCDAPENRAELAALLAGTLLLPAALVNGALGHLSFAAGGRPTQADGVRLLGDMARAGQVGGIDAAAAAAQVFRPDLFDAAVSGPIA